MSLRSVALAVAVLAVLSVAFVPVVATGAASDSATSGSANATLVAAYPNPVADGDPGEYVVVRFPEPTNTSGWTLTDGTAIARLPNRTLKGTVALSTEPADARSNTLHRVSALSGRLPLANDGDRLELASEDGPVAVARYRNAPESKRRNFRTETWVPIGATDHEPVRTGGGSATAFVLPDAPDVTVDRLGAAERRILIGGYTLTSERVADVLLEAAADGVDVRVLLDGGPVGGITQRQARLLDALAEGGVDVRLLAGPHARYRFHHAKYAVVDDQALVLTENFKPAGTGGASSRGWGVALEDSAVADELAAIHEGDRTWRAATPWSRYREGRTFVDGEAALGSFESEHAPERVDIDSATVLVAPDNAATELVTMIDDADERLLLQQVRIDSRRNELLKATIRAADRGVRVRIHLDGSWYVEEENADLIEWLNRRAEAEGWDLEAKLDDPEGYEKIHTKGLVIDDTAVLGSLNWVRSAQSRNREVVVALEGEEPAEYYATVFEDEWDSDEAQPVPAGIFAAAAVAGSAALLVLRRIEIVGRAETVSEWQW